MSISYSTAAATMQLKNAVQLSVTKMSMDNSKQNAAGMVDMLNNLPTAPHPNLGAKLDIKV